MANSGKRASRPRPHSPATTFDLGELVEIASELARAAAAVIQQRPAELFTGSKTTPTDAVTVVDKEAERVILSGLSRLRPADRIIAEEGGNTPGTTGVTWFVDPLDGTVNYLYGLRPYAVSIAASVAEEPIAAAVLDVACNELYLAMSGLGATCNGQPLICSDQREPAMALVATGFAYDSGIRAWQGRILAESLPRVRDIRRAGCAAVDLCNVASGRVDAFYEAGMHPWDWMAGMLIAREAGARVGGLAGRPPGRRGTLAANPKLFAALETILLEAGAAECDIAE